MSRLNDVHAKLYRALLAKKVGSSAVLNGPKVQAVSTVELRSDNVLMWSISFDLMSGNWSLVMVLNGKALPRFQDKLLSEVLYIRDREIYDQDRCIEWQEEAEAEAEAQALAEADRLEILASIPSMEDGELVSGYEEAKAAYRRRCTEVSEWSWHPDYTGPDDPGLEYYQRARDHAYEEMSHFEAEMRKRNVLPFPSIACRRWDELEAAS